ncbi:MAG: galactokinase [Acidimicrobiia bacterium]
MDLGPAFALRFGDEPEVVVRSPGRVNLIGEHTDYNEGWVLPVAVDLGTWLAARPRSDGLLSVASLRLEVEDRAHLADLRPTEGPRWTRYVRGMAALLLEAGEPLVGADVLIDGDLPLEAGLSSSASLEMGVAVLLLALAGRPVDRRGLARLGRRVENEVVGVQSGIMDQLAVACGEEGRALLIDCRTLRVEPVPFPPGMALLVIDSGIPRSLDASPYNQRRAECRAALRGLQEAEPRLRALRDATPELLEAHPLAPLLGRRARHVVGENRRVHQAATALRSGDTAHLGRLMVEAHRSLRDDFEASTPEIDSLVEMAVSKPGVPGARLTGAGFGGSVVALVEEQRAQPAGGEIVESYRRTTGRAGRAYICLPGPGVSVIG